MTLSLAGTTEAESVKLSADGSPDTYRHINSFLAPDGDAIEVPDCRHLDFGPHITQVRDVELDQFVFRFHIHRDEDDDRCQKDDRQRVEIKVYDKSPDKLKARANSVFTYRWKFRLPLDFQPSQNFTHFHQIKAVGGPEANVPLLTLSARKGKAAHYDRFELRHSPERKQHTAHWVPLSPLLGRWLAVEERIHYGEIGKIAITIIAMKSGQPVFEFAAQNLRMWKTDADFQRPKWGIYRSLKERQTLKDETVDFADFEIEF